jgi:hypothetical protein
MLLYTIRHFNDTATQTVEQGKSDFETSQLQEQCKS